MAKSDTAKQKGPQIDILWNDGVPEATYFKNGDYLIKAKVEKGKFILSRFGWDEDPAKEECLVVSPKDTLKLMDSLKVKNPDTMLRALGKRFALKEPHNAFVKIKTSLDRRGVAYELK